MNDGDPGSPGTAEGDAPRTFAVRVNPRANREMIDAMLTLEDHVGEEGARQWYLGLRAAAASLRTFPRRYHLRSVESRYVGVEARRVLYRGPSGQAAGYHLYFFVEDDTDDGPRVVVFHVRHASRRPLTRAEGRALNDEL